MESLKIKSSLGQIRNTVESYDSRLEQEEHRISGLKDNVDIIRKTDNK
jgi:hypothetical protein